MMTETMTEIKEICSVPSHGKRRGRGVWGKEAKTFENYKTAGAWADIILQFELRILIQKLIMSLTMILILIVTVIKIVQVVNGGGHDFELQC